MAQHDDDAAYDLCMCSVHERASPDASAERAALRACADDAARFASWRRYVRERVYLENVTRILTIATKAVQAPSSGDEPWSEA